MAKKRNKRQARLRSRAPRPAQNPLQRRAGRGFRGYPIATVAYYGPDDRFASKVVVGILLQEGEDVAWMKKWFGDETDVRRDLAINREIVAFLNEHRAKSVAMVDRIIGCPHEEGKDYPRGESCPQCPFWADRDRWTGDLLSAEPTPAPPVPMRTACAWYRAEQWGRLLEIAADREDLADTYEEWLATAEDAMASFEMMGVAVEKMDVNVEELLARCRAEGLAVDGGARAQCVSELLHRKYAGREDAAES